MIKHQICTYTGIGNTDNPELKVESIVAAYAIPNKQNFMQSGGKFSVKKDLTPRQNYSMNQGSDYEY